MAELRAQNAELTLEHAAYAGRARAARHDGMCPTAYCTSAACRVLVPRTCHTTQCASAFAVKRSCQLALLGRAERAQRARATQR
jgi:hypothetical protein